MPKLQNVGEYSYAYGLAEKKQPSVATKAKTKHSLGRLSSGIASSVFRNKPSLEGMKQKDDHFDNVALLSDNDVDDDADDDASIFPKQMKKSKNKKKFKSTRRSSNPVSNAKHLLRSEVEQLDGFNQSEINVNRLGLADPKLSVLQNLKKTPHGIW